MGKREVIRNPWRTAKEGAAMQKWVSRRAGVIIILSTRRDGDAPFGASPNGVFCTDLRSQAVAYQLKKGQTVTVADARSERM